ncbi:MAG: hypothetical protein E6G60_07865 [Actinobacteria bacterium]|nr:MAG: hypothetical protein E6G60_07865 [Actinomycetota bacterium]
MTVLAGACGGGNKEAAKPKPKPTTTTRARQTTIDVEIGRAMLETASLSSPPFPDEVRDPVKSELVRYVEVAMITPLRTGKVASSASSAQLSPTKASAEQSARSNSPPSRYRLPRSPIRTASRSS